MPTELRSARLVIAAGGNIGTEAVTRASLDGSSCLYSTRHSHGLVMTKRRKSKTRQILWGTVRNVAAILRASLCSRFVGRLLNSRLVSIPGTVGPSSVIVVKDPVVKRPTVIRFGQ